MMPDRYVSKCCLFRLLCKPEKSDVINICVDAARKVFLLLVSSYASYSKPMYIGNQIFLIPQGLTFANQMSPVLSILGLDFILPVRLLLLTELLSSSGVEVMNLDLAFKLERAEGL